MNLPLHSVNHQDRINDMIAREPGRITGSTVIVDQKDINPNQIYFTVQDVYQRLLVALRDKGHIGKEPAAVDDFTFIGFPRAIVQLDLLETVDVIVSIKEGSLVLELFFNYKGAASIRYETSVHTSMSYLPTRALVEALQQAQSS